MTTPQRHWCTYDNPTTRCRELWVDGRMMQWISASIIEDKMAADDLGGHESRWGAPWSDERIHGDIKALGDGRKLPTAP